MSKHSEYEKMPKSLKQLDVPEKVLGELNKLKWTVTEKIHGANFSFVYEHRKLQYAKRKEFLSWTDDFFGFQEVVVRIEDNVLQLFEQLSTDFEADRYIIYGELFGGKYPHPNVPVHSNVQAIQTGVYYSPVIDFCAFDIAFEREGVKHYLDYETAISYFETHGIFYAAVLFAGKLNEVLDFNIRINSMVPSLLKLPLLDHNLIEGVVIKPWKHSHIKNLSVRPILKIKNPEFDEEKKFHEAEKWSFIPNVSSKSEELSFIMEEMARYVNENRINSAVSKIGRLDFTNEQRLQQIRDEILEDVWNDFNLNNSNLVNDLSAEHQEWIRKRLSALVADLLNNNR